MTSSAPVPGNNSAGAISCSLPVASGGGPPQPAGFISLPSGAFTPDSTSVVSYDAASLRFATVQAPVLYGDSGAPTYDLAYRRWLPVKAAQVLPDGSAYVYTRAATPTPMRNEIHLVNVATGADRLIYDKDAYHALAFQPEGIYLDYHLNGTDGFRGLWLLNPTTQALKAFPGGGQTWWAVVGGAGAWSYSVDGSRFGSTSFARLDLSTDAMTSWFSVSSVQPPQPGFKTVHVIGFDGSAHPLVDVFVDRGTPEVWLLTGPGQASRVAGLPLLDFIPSLGVTDSHGTWLAGTNGVYLYAGSGFKRVAAPPPFSGIVAGNFTIAGPCA